MALFGVNPAIPGVAGLQQGVNQRLSNQATDLQAAMAAKGVPGQQPSSATFRRSNKSPSKVTQLLMQQDEEQGQLEARAQDLSIAQRLLQLFDPRIPKQARQFLYKELSRSIGVDPKGERSKDVGAMITSLDPQTLEGLRTQLTDAISNAQPGVVQQFAKGVLSGQIAGSALAPVIADAAQPAPTDDGMMRLGGPRASASSESASQPQQPQRIPFTADPAPLAAEPTEASVPALQREVVPELASTLGLDSTVRYRVRDIYGAGYNRVPSNAAGMRKMAMDIKGTQDGLINTMLLSGQLINLIQEGGPEALDLIRVKIPLTDSIVAINPANVIDQVVELSRGLGNLFGTVEFDEADLNAAVEAVRNPDAASPALNRATNRIREYITETYGYTGDTAVLNARIRGMIVPLAFMMAAAKGQSGRFLSDRDVELMLNEIGLSQSPKQMIASIKDMVKRVYDGYNIKMRVHVGAEVPIHPVVPQEVADVLQTSGVGPARLMKNLGIEALPPPKPPANLGGPRGEGIPGSGMSPEDVDGPSLLMQRAQAAARASLSQDRAAERARLEGIRNGLASRGRDTSAVDAQIQRLDAMPGADTTVSQTTSNVNIGGDTPINRDLVRMLGGRPQDRERQPLQSERRAARIADRPTPRPLQPYTPRTIARSGPTLEEETEAARRRVTEDRAFVREQRGMAREVHAMREREDARAARAEARAAEALTMRQRAETRAIEEARRSRIQEAFNNVARAIMSGGGSGGSASVVSAGSQDQDPSAFQLTAPPQRRAPTPVNAAAFRRR